MTPQTPRKEPRRFRLQEHLGVLFTALVLITGATIAFTGYRMMARTVTSASDHLVASVSSSVRGETISSIYQPARLTTLFLTETALPRAKNLDERMAALPSIKSTLDIHPLVDAVFIGYENGEFFLVRPLRDKEVLARFNAPASSAFLVQSITPAGGEMRTQYLFFDSNLQELQRRDMGEAAFDPRSRPWFQEAKKESGLIATAPYIFFTTKSIGTTFACRVEHAGAVVGMDVGLAPLSQALSQELPTPGSKLVLLRPDGTAVASESGMVEQQAQQARIRTVEDLDPIVRMGVKAYKDGRTGYGLDMNDGERDWKLSLEEINFAGKVPGVILLAVPEDEILGDAVNFVRQTIMITGGILLLAIPLIWLMAKRIARPLSALAEKARLIQEFRLEDGEGVDSSVAEVHDLSEGMEHMQGNLKKFLAITGTISAERNFALLLERVLRETLAVASADGGMVALLDKEKNCFNDGSACWTSDGNEMTHCLIMDCKVPDPTLPVYKALDSHQVVSETITRNDPRASADFLAPGFADPEVTQVDVVAVPLYDRMDETLGTLSLFKAIKPGTPTFQTQQVAFIAALAKTAAIALENQSLIRAQEELRDALIHIIAGAIDAKSPYTGGHCQRVPVIFLMLMQAACDAKDGPLRDFSMTEDEWEEAKLAGWLHDCGKVTTPEYVVDKATKLETIYDRIHEIRTRFEVLKRDAEITSLKAVQAGADAEEENKKLAENLRQLDDDFAFIASCNIGGESMDEAKIERLTAIAQRTWLRTLDKRLGVSRDELLRMDAEPATPLPVVEPLLADRPEHIIERTDKDKIPPENPWRFKMDTPEHLYNRGELHNLGIRYGTLSPEERYKINDHIIQTIIMLNKLPLPGYLKGVPDMAGSHHETMDGKGYPRRLSRDDMDWKARAMAIADIFEALTASDRPYKPSKTLSEALKIMDGFKARNHIDPDLYELFLEARVPQLYADKYLKPEQNDMP